jgi:hypothetical protein
LVGSVGRRGGQWGCGEGGTPAAAALRAPPIRLGLALRVTTRTAAVCRGMLRPYMVVPCIVFAGACCGPTWWCPALCLQGHAAALHCGAAQGPDPAASGAAEGGSGPGPCGVGWGGAFCPCARCSSAQIVTAGGGGRILPTPARQPRPLSVPTACLAPAAWPSSCAGCPRCSTATPSCSSSSCRWAARSAALAMPSPPPPSPLPCLCSL